MLLNKADLLPAAVRRAWADYFDARGRRHVFWSAAAAADEQQRARHEASVLGLPVPAPMAEQRAAAAAASSSSSSGKAGGGSSGGGKEVEFDRVRVLGVEELLEVLEDAARAAVAAAPADDPRRADDQAGRRLVVGLVGYPNVGKSSTINAIFGSKKTAVAPTPGKTKHFQTLNVSPTMCLCDCPGLVLPRFAGSRADMVAAGVVPIDRLTEVRPPVDVVARRCGTRQLESAYTLKLAPPSAGPAPPPPRAQQLLAILAAARGWAAGGGLPDEARAGRTILKDYTAGRLVHCQLPPGSDPPSWAPNVAPDKAPDLESMPLVPVGLSSSSSAAAGAGAAVAAGAPSLAAAAKAGADADSGDEADAAAAADLAAAAAAGGAGGPAAAASAVAATSAAALADSANNDALLLDPADLELLEGLGLEGAPAGARKPKPQRPDYKMHKKAARGPKGARGAAKDEGGYDGAALAVGKRGGLVRVVGYQGVEDE